MVMQPIDFPLQLGKTCLQAPRKAQFKMWVFPDGQKSEFRAGTTSAVTLLRSFGGKTPKRKKVFWDVSNTQTQIINVWYIYLHLDHLWGFYVGKYSIHGSSGRAFARVFFDLSLKRGCRRARSLSTSPGHLLQLLPSRLGTARADTAGDECADLLTSGVPSGNIGETHFSWYFQRT